LLLLASCGGDGAPSILDPAGPAAERVEGLWWLMLWISVAVLLLVVVFLAASLRRPGRIDDPIVEGEPKWGERFIAGAGVFASWVVLAAVFVVSLGHVRDLSAQGKDTSLTIEVVGHMWWWEVRYPNGAVTANEIHIPAGDRVRILLTTADVIHSFWVPQLQVKIDQVPGRTNELWLQADEPGRYRGQCAEYCGLQHANMIFFVIADTPVDFDDWLANEARPAPEPVAGNEETGRQVFLDNTCLGCHTIRGTEARETLGPDLTHLAARQTIASGMVANTRESLAAMITDPQGLKPGNTMPPTALDPEELDALLDYMESLR
jgi:cytochrome c oxidase subunit 2